MRPRAIDPAHAPYRLVIRRSRIHRLGVFAAQRIPRGRKVIEYTGERVSFAEAERRWTPKLNYLFNVKNGVIDGMVGGSGAEYVNHCCAPNLKARLVRGHLLFYSLRMIGKGEELTLDYKYRVGAKEDYPCACGAASCRGSIVLDRRDTRTRRAPQRR
jgi:SET domain-containing protein